MTAYEKSNFGRIEDKSEYYGATIKVLAPTKDFEPTFSIEIARKNDFVPLASFRQDKKERVEEFLALQFKAFGRFLAEKEYFNEVGTNEAVEDDTMTELIEIHFRHLARKCRESFGDGVRSYYEEKNV